MSEKPFDGSAPVRVCIDLPSAEQALAWVARARECGLMWGGGSDRPSVEVGLRALDALDAKRIPQGRTFIVSRPAYDDGHWLKIERTTTTETKLVS